MAPYKDHIGRYMQRPPDRHGRIAQLVEQLTLNQRVLGSNPSASTTSSLTPNRRHRSPLLKKAERLGHAVRPAMGSPA